MYYFSSGQEKNWKSILSVSLSNETERERMRWYCLSKQVYVLLEVFILIMKRCLDRILDPCLMSFLINSWIKSLFVIFIIIHENGRGSGWVCLSVWFKDRNRHDSENTYFLSEKDQRQTWYQRKKKKEGLFAKREALAVSEASDARDKEKGWVCLSSHYTASQGDWA